MNKQRITTTPIAGGWDTYWSKQAPSQRAYGVIANIYRKWIIKRTLNHYVRTLFPVGAVLLHAGSGGGEVDTDLNDEFCLIAIDFSNEAVKTYAACHPNSGRLLLADVLKLPFAAESFDGIFNLGVMEHFTEEEIVLALTEIRRALKPNGHVVLFWPPVWGLSVIALRSLHKVVRVVFRKDLNLHPAELNLVRSRKQCEKWLTQAGLTLELFRFGIRDLFTHQIVVARKTQH